jgi:hypothetical protein
MENFPSEVERGGDGAQRATGRGGGQVAETGMAARAGAPVLLHGQG